MNLELKSISIRGYKTIDLLEPFVPRPINVLIGPNGAGKSNFISFFRLLSWMLASPPQLQKVVGLQGAAGSVLLDGPKVTKEIEAELTIKTQKGENDFRFRLAHAANDTFVFAEEAYRFSGSSFAQKAAWKSLGSGHRESHLVDEADAGDKTAGTIRGLLLKLVVHQFHDTSFQARIRGTWDATDGRWLKEDGGNIAAVLLQLRDDEPACYHRIVQTLRLVLPFFADFVLEPEHGRLLLRWRELGSDMVFSAAQAADGMLRTMALITLLGSPVSRLPGVLILDEPELGLHPAAIDTVGAMIRSLSRDIQVMVATQSVSLIDNFDPQDVVVVERQGRTSTFRRLHPEDMDQWLDEYSLSEIWEKNIVGGRP